MSRTGSGIVRPLRIAIVGAGKMGRHHARAITRLGPSVNLVAIADPSSPARSALCEQYPSVKPFASLDRLLTEAQPDIVHVCTAPDSHERLAALAIDAGCHVYVEKPFVTTQAAAQRLLGQATTRGVKVCVGHQLLFEPAARELLDTLSVLGEIVHIESYFSFRTVRRAPDGRAPLRADQQLIDILPHSVSLLLRALTLAAPGARSELASLQVGPAGTVHALVRRGGLTGALVVTLDGRPIESFVRVVGTNGAVHADFVRGTVQHLIGPGSSGIDKALAPFRVASQLVFGTTRVLAARILKRQRSYPGLSEIFNSFYSAVRADGPSPTDSEELLDTVRICEEIARRLTAPAARIQAPSPRLATTGRRVLVTGGTGFLGRAVVRELVERRIPVRVLARRLPSEWERISDVEYIACDLAEGVAERHLSAIDIVIHCAAETAGGKLEHERNSIGATERLFRAVADAGIREVIHISSLAVLAAARGRSVLDESSPLEAARERCGPYVWGKLESEELAVRLGAQLGLEVKVVRPGAIIDFSHFEPPGRLGKRVGNVFVAVGSKGSKLGVVELDFAARAIAWTALHFASAAPIVNLLTPTLPTRGELVERLRRTNPGITVIWLPRAALHALSLAALVAQKLLRPNRAAINVARVFSSQRYSTERAAELSDALNQEVAPASSRDEAPSTTPEQIAAGA